MSPASRVPLQLLGRSGVSVSAPPSGSLATALARIAANGAVAGLALVAPVAARAADMVVGHVSRPSTVRSYAGVQVFSAFEDDAYHLAIRRKDAVELLPVPPSRAPFDVDVGPDREGRPQLVYSRCKVERAGEIGRNDNRGCDLFAFSLASGGERPIRSANTSANEFAPTLWKGRIAFARALTRRQRPIVYMTELGAPRRRRAERLPRIPWRVPGRRTTGGEVDALELHGGRLAQIVSLQAEGQLSEVRLVDLSARSTRTLSRVGFGETLKYFAGIGFADGYVMWSYDRAVGAGGPLSPGIYRYRLTTGEVSRSPLPAVVDYQVVGLAPFAADGAYLIDAQLESDDGCGGEPEFVPPVVRRCQLIRSQPLRFRRSDETGARAIG